jgi:hypothetical protein
VLGVVALAGLRPWATSAVVPNLSLAPGIGAAVGDSTAVAQAESPTDAGTGGIVAPRSAPTVSPPVAVSTPERRGSRAVLAVSAGQALTVAAPVPVSSPPAPQPSAPSPGPVVPAPAPAPEAASVSPVVANVPSVTPGAPGGPVASGVGGLEPEPSCDGDEYIVTVTFEETEGEEVDYEEAEADIVVRQIDADGNETEVQLRGDLSDVRDLIATLVAEGNCVHLEAGTAAGDGTPSVGTSPVVVPTEGVPSPAPDPDPGEPAAPHSP